MYIGTRNKVSEANFPPLICKNKTIREVDQFKYLGVILDKTLKFDKHTSYIKRKVFIRMKWLVRIRTFISTIQLYKSLRVPHIDYGDVVYDAACHNECKDSPSDPEWLSYDLLQSTS